MGFTSDEYIVREDQGYMLLPIEYHGNSTAMANVTCQLHFGTADMSDAFQLHPYISQNPTGM